MNRPAVIPRNWRGSTVGFERICAHRRRDDFRGRPRTIPPPAHPDIYPTVVADGSLYFVSNRPGGVGRSDIYRAPRLSDGRFGTRVNIGRPANTDGGEGDPFESPDERYLIITKDGEFGQADLFVSFRAADGSWGENDDVRGWRFLIRVASGHVCQVFANASINAVQSPHANSGGP